MQVIAAPRLIAPPRPPRALPVLSIAWSLVFGSALVAVAAAVVYVSFGTPLLFDLASGGQLTTSRVPSKW